MEDEVSATAGNWHKMHPKTVNGNREGIGRAGIASNADQCACHRWIVWRDSAHQCIVGWIRADKADAINSMPANITRASCPLTTTPISTCSCCLPARTATRRASPNRRWVRPPTRLRCPLRTTNCAASSGCPACSCASCGWSLRQRRRR